MVIIFSGSPFQDCAMVEVSLGPRLAAAGTASLDLAGQQESKSLRDYMH